MKKLLCLLILKLCSAGFAQATVRQSDLLGVEGRTLGFSCFAFSRVTHGAPCNPAQSAQNPSDEFYGDFLWSNQLEFVSEASRLLQGDGDAAMVESLFSQNRESTLDTNLELGYRTPLFTLTLLPYQIRYYSTFSNSVLPETELFVSRETSLRLQAASYLNEDLAVGLLVRLEHQRFVSTRFFLTDILAESRDDFMEVETQNSLLLEPGVLYHLPDDNLRPELSFTLKNWGFRSSSRVLEGQDIRGHFSASINPRFSSSQAGLGVDLYIDRKVDSFSEIATLGGYYQFGILTLLSSLGEERSALGFSIQHRALTAGLSFSRENTQNAYGEDRQVDRIFSQIGFEL